MKLQFFLLLLAALLTGAQSTAQHVSIEDADFDTYFFNKENIPKVSGRILNLSQEQMASTRIEYEIVSPVQQGHIPKYCVPNNDGTFEFKFDHALPYQQVWVTIDSLFFTGIYANKDLFIELDAAILKTQAEPYFTGPGIRYLGADGPLNEYMNKNAVYKQEQKAVLEQARHGISRTINDQNEQASLRAFDSLSLALNEISRAFIEQNPSEFLWMLENEETSAYLRELLYVLGARPIPATTFERVKRHKPLTVSNNSIGFYRGLTISLQAAAFKNHKSGTPIENKQRRLALLDSLDMPLKANLLHLQFLDKTPQTQQRSMEMTLSRITTEWCKQMLVSDYDESQRKLAEVNKALLGSLTPTSSGLSFAEPVGELPFGAKLYTVDSISATDLLSNLKTAFSGKALLIDCWATWCGPCIGEFPYSKKLSAACKDLPLEFVYICTTGGSPMDTWKSKIVEHQISGTHLYVDNRIVGDLLKMFSSAGYPTYAFIDRQGTYRPEAQIRPSSTSREQLIQLVK